MNAILVRAALATGFLFAGPHFGQAQQNNDAARQRLSPVSVELKAAPLSEVCEALSKATGLPFLAGRAIQPAAFTLSATDRPFWDVFVELSKQNALTIRPAMGGIELHPQGAAVPMLVAGPMLIVAEVATAQDWAGPAAGSGQAPPAARRGLAGRPPFVPGGASAIPRYTGRGPGAEQAPPEGAQFVVRLAAIGDPRLIATRAALGKVELLDDAGKPMKVLEVRTTPTGPLATTGPWQPRPDDYQRLNFSTWRIAVAGEEGGGKGVASIKGFVKLRVSTKDVRLQLDDVENKHVGESHELGNAKFTLPGPVALTANRLRFQYRAELGGEELAGEVDVGGRDSLPPLRILVLNAAGQPVIATGTSRQQTNGNLSVEAGPRGTSAFPLTGPFSVVLTASEHMEAIEVPFEMKLGGM